jgi:hypothetical protein
MASPSPTMNTIPARLSRRSTPGPPATAGQDLAWGTDDFDDDLAYYAGVAARNAAHRRAPRTPGPWSRFVASIERLTRRLESAASDGKDPARRDAGEALKPLDAILTRLDALDARLDAAQRPLLTVREAGNLLGLGRDATQRLCKAHGVLVDVGGGRGLRVLREDLMAALRSAPGGDKPQNRVGGASRSRGVRSRSPANPANLGDYDEGLLDPDGKVVWNPEFG